MSDLSNSSKNKILFAQRGFICLRIYKYENHNLAIARSSSSRADPGLRVAVKCLNV